jgi:NADH-quinone oxidoreductase subunit E
MAISKITSDKAERFAFSQEKLAWANDQLKKYPDARKQSAVIPFLWEAQKENGGYVDAAVVRTISQMLDMAEIRVYEVVSFYTMFNTEPVGEHFVQVCTTTPCWLRGSDDIVKICKSKISEYPNKVTEDGKFSWMEVECLGACANAPMVQINDDYFEDLDADIMKDMLDALAAGKTVTPGSQKGRSSSEPMGDPTSLTDPTLYDGAPAGGAE